MPCLCVGVALSASVFQPSPTGPGDPAVAWVAPSGAGSEELACFPESMGPL